MVALIMSRHYAPYIFECDTVENAVQTAVRHLDDGLAYPVKIEQDGRLIWEQDGPMGPAIERLREMAREE